MLTNRSTILGKTHTDVMAKCNELWNAAGRPKSAEIIQGFLGHTLSRPGATRWNSLYDALKNIIKIKNKNSQIVRALEVRNPIREADFDNIEEFVQCADPIAKAPDLLQADESFYGIVMPCLLALRQKLQKLSKQSFKYC